MDRREFLKKSMLLTAGALIGGSLFSETSAAKGAKQNGIPRKKKSIGLQLYSIGGDMSADAAQALRQISEMGYSTAETASYGDGKFYGRTPAEFRKMAEDLGIAVTGAHIARELDKNDMQGCMDWWKQACDAQAAVGGKTIVMPYFPVGSTLADLQDYCDYFNRVGEIANAAGLRFGYHNHSHEFNKIEGQVIEDYMIENTDPDKVFFQMDVYWTVMGQASPVDYFTKYPGRFRLLHIKDRREVGQSGMVGYDAIFCNAATAGVENIIVEMEGSSYGDVLRSVRECVDYLNEAPFVEASYAK